MEDIIAECLRSLTDLTKWDEIIFDVVCRTACSCGTAILEAIDDELAKRRVEGLRMVSKRSKTIVTKFGFLKIKRRMYQEKSGKKRFLLDEALGFIKGSQATASMQTIAIKLATLMPFRQAAMVLSETSGGVLSHQMIHRILQQKGAEIDVREKIATEGLMSNGELPTSENKRTDRLFIEADGTFINLQRESKKKAEIKLLTAYEGWRRVGKNKYGLQSKTVMAGFDHGGAIWDSFTAKLLETYHPEVLGKIIVGGDGATWIKSGADSFHGSLYQLDRFHLRRALLRATGNIGHASKAYKLAATGDVLGASAALESFAEKNPDKEIEIKKCINYLKKNASGLIDYRDRIKNPSEDYRGLGSIESNIDKILANRLKKRGMAWSYSGAHHMAKAIQTISNDDPLPIQKATELPQRLVNTISRRIIESIETDPSQWLEARMPALIGPHQSRPWVKALRNLSRVTNGGIAAVNFLPTKI